MASVRFTKMQGIGNDYVYINGYEEKLPDPVALARRISDRHFGVGSDGLVLILPSQIADVRMRMFNADGSESEMCGNAVRCVAKYAYDHGLCTQERLSVETGAGVKEIRLLFDSTGAVSGASVDMGEPELAPARIPVRAHADEARLISHPIELGDQVYAITTVSMGNPHAVIFMRDIDNLDLSRIGPRFEHHPMFPNRINTEFAEVVSDDKLRMRVWERGAGETLACGTGACATAVAGVLNGHTAREVDVALKGGTLHILWEESSNHVYMSGPAVTVFDGHYPL